MKKGFKLSIASVMAVSALTPVAAFADTTPAAAAANGFYTTDSFTTPTQFKNLSAAERQDLLKRADLVLVVSGEVYFGKEALGKTDAQLEEIKMTEAAFEEEYGELTTSGYEKEEVVEGVTVESVMAINNTGVEVTFPEVTEAIEDANVVVKDGEGNVVPTEAKLLAEGETSAEFVFTTPFKSDYKFTGVWTVNGKEYNFDAINQLADIVEAVGAGNEITLQAALDAAGISYADETRIAQYLGALQEEGSTATLEAVQKAITKIDEEAVTKEDKEAAVEEVDKAKTQAQLLKALQDHFELVNPEWIVNYASPAGDGEATFNGDLLEFPVTIPADVDGDYEKIQNAIYQVNIAKAALKVTNANGKLDSKKVSEARTLVTNWVPAFDLDDTQAPVILGDSVAGLKEFTLDALKLEDAYIAINNAKTNSALKAALVNLDKVESDILEKYEGTDFVSGKTKDFHLENVLDENLTAYRTAIAEVTEVGGKNQRSDINDIILGVNQSFGSLKAEEAKVSAGTKAKPAFTITALRKDEKVFEDMASATDIKVKIGNEAFVYKVTDSSDFTDSPKGKLAIEFNTAVDGQSDTGFNLNKVGTQTEATITFKADGKDYSVKAPVKVTAGAANNTTTSATLKLDNIEGTYASGEDVAFTFTLKDDANNTLASENGTYASTITVGDDTYYQNIKFVDGTTSVSVPARKANDDAQVKVKFTPKNGSEVTVTSSKNVKIEAGEFSKLDVTNDGAQVSLIAKDGVNKITDFGTKLVNIKAVKLSGENNEIETPVTVAGTDYQGNVTKDFAEGVATHDTQLAAGTYKVTVTVDGVTTTKTITIGA